jgi:DNA (cytosine-5)-methyltransferase 1
MQLDFFAQTQDTTAAVELHQAVQAQPKFKDTRTYKVGSNKGTPRVWLEGKMLDNAGFTARAAYSAKINRKTIVLTIDPEGDYIVSGKNMTPEYRKPVIDLHRAALTDVLRDAETVTVVFRDGVITIRPDEV